MGKLRKLFVSWTFLFLFEVIKLIQPVVLQELRMYNPEYLERPYVVVLNKIDLPEVSPYTASTLCFKYLPFRVSTFIHIEDLYSCFNISIILSGKE